MDDLAPLLWIAIPTAVTLLLVVFTMGFFGGNKMPVDGKTVLLTGASEGMGLNVALQLAAKGANIVIVARNVGKLEEALAAIKAVAKNPHSQRFHYISADVSVPDYAPGLVAEVITWNKGQAPDIVWTLAGMSIPDLFAEAEYSNVRTTMDINFHGSAQLAHAILREWLAPNAPVDAQPKHLIFTASVLAFFTTVGYSSYSPSKYALRGLADTLAQEVMLYPQDVKVHVVYPGTILTDGFNREMQTKPEVTCKIEEMDSKQRPDEVATAAIRGLENGDHYVTVNYLGSAMKWGALGGSLRNNWVVDLIMGWLISIVWLFALPDVLSKVKKYKKEHGHPSTYTVPKYNGH